MDNLRGEEPAAGLQEWHHGEMRQRGQGAWVRLQRFSQRTQARLLLAESGLQEQPGHCPERN